MPAADSGAPRAPAATNCAASRDAVRTACSRRCSAASQLSVSGLERTTRGNLFSTRSTRSSTRRIRAVATSRSIAPLASTTPTSHPPPAQHAPSGTASRCRRCGGLLSSHRTSQEHVPRTWSGLSGQAQRAVRHRAAPDAAGGGVHALDPRPIAFSLGELSRPPARSHAALFCDPSAGAPQTARPRLRPNPFGRHLGLQIHRAMPQRWAGSGSTARGLA